MTVAPGIIEQRIGAGSQFDETLPTTTPVDEYGIRKFPADTQGGLFLFDFAADYGVSPIVPKSFETYVIEQIFVDFGDAATAEIAIVNSDGVPVRTILVSPGAGTYLRVEPVTLAWDEKLTLKTLGATVDLYARVIASLLVDRCLLRSEEGAMGRLSEELGEALRPGPPDCEGLIVKVAKLENEQYPGRGAHGVLPVLVVGHAALSEAEWAGWVKRHATAPYGVAYAAKLARQGVDLKDMLPTAAIGRNMRQAVGESSRWRVLDHAGYVLTLVEKWPSLYNEIAEEMGEESMTLSRFVRRVQELPSPVERGEGRMTTLGDLIGRVVTVTPSF